MKKIILRLNESYIETLKKTRLLTQISAFSIVVMMAVMLFNLISDILQANEISQELKQSLTKDIFLDLCIISFFGSRFILMFFETKISVWLSQFIWFASFITLINQISSLESGGCTKNVFPMFGEVLSSIFVVYLIFSPLRQLLTLSASIFTNFKK